jgi:hypothetical protein
MIAPRHAGHTAEAHNLAAFDHVAHAHLDPAEMPVDRLQSVAVIDHNAVAVDAERSSPNDAVLIRCLDADMLCDGKVITEVNLLVDFLSVIDTYFFLLTASSRTTLQGR